MFSYFGFFLLLNVQVKFYYQLLSKFVAAENNFLPMHLCNFFPHLKLLDIYLQDLCHRSQCKLLHAYINFLQIPSRQICYSHIIPPHSSLYFTLSLSLSLSLPISFASSSPSFFPFPLNAVSSTTSIQYLIPAFSILIHFSPINLHDYLQRFSIQILFSLQTSHLLIKHKRLPFSSFELPH